MNTQTPTVYGNTCRKQAAIREAQDRFYTKWIKLVSEQHDDIERIKREGVS